MKLVIAFFLCISFFADCTKKEKLCCEPPEIGFFGKWVDVNNRQDTLVVYTEGYRQILFDNSAYYRSVQSTIYTTQYKYQFELKDGKIGVKSYTASTSDPFIYYDLTWLESGRKFTMLLNAIRPYLSSLPMVIYERVY